MYWLELQRGLLINSTNRKVCPSLRVFLRAKIEVRPLRACHYQSETKQQQQQKSSPLSNESITQCSRNMLKNNNNFSIQSTTTVQDLLILFIRDNPTKQPSQPSRKDYNRLCIAYSTISREDNRFIKESNQINRSRKEEARTNRERDNILFHGGN